MVPPSFRDARTVKDLNSSLDCRSVDSYLRVGVRKTILQKMPAFFAKEVSIIDRHKGGRGMVRVALEPRVTLEPFDDLPRSNVCAGHHLSIENA